MHTILIAALLAFGRPEDEEFQSENQSRSVRPAARGTVAQIFSAEDVQALTAQDGKSVRVQGKVHSIYVPDSQKVCVLNMGPDRKTCLKITIFASAWEKWPNGLAGLKKQYDKKTLTIEGRVELYNNLPEIVATLPSQITVKD